MLRQCLLFYFVLTLANSVVALDIFIGASFLTIIEEQTDYSLHNNNYTLGGHGLLSSWSCNVENNIVCLCYAGTLHLTFLRQSKNRRHGRQCVYYNNTTATFRTLLIGDLVFKLNPGPTRSKISPIASMRHSYRPLRPTTSRDAEQPSRLSSRNTNNLITVNCSNYLNVHYQSLKFCVLNARSVRNKTADILDYICECKLDVVGITESWLSSDDAAVRIELCPDGYKFRFWITHATGCAVVGLV